MFSAFVVRQTGHSARVANMRGVVLENLGERGASRLWRHLYRRGWPHRARAIPVANLKPAAY